MFICESIKMKRILSYDTIFSYNQKPTSSHILSSRLNPYNLALVCCCSCFYLSTTTWHYCFTYVDQDEEKSILISHGFSFYPYQWWRRYHELWRRKHKYIGLPAMCTIEVTKSLDKDLWNIIMPLCSLKDFINLMNPFHTLKRRNIAYANLL